MKRTRGGNGPTLKRPESVTLSEKNPQGRLILIVLLIVIAVTAFTAGVMDLLKPDTGWQDIKVNPSAETVCGQDFSFRYHLGVSGMAANAEYKLLEKVYTEASDQAYKIFTNETFEGVNNIAYLNAHVNETVKVDKVLYDALILFDEYDSRYLYLAPVYEQYRGLFSSANDVEAEMFDPYVNQMNRDYFAQIADFANRPEMIDIEILGENQVKLNVSKEYLAYAEENGIASFIDFFWLKNAFVLDYITDALTAQNFTKGTISSFDGFSATLDLTGSEYAYTVYDRIGNTVYPAAVMKYTKPMNSVSMRNYPVSDLDMLNYYELENGEIRTPFVDTKDGLCKSSMNNLVVFSENRSCAETALAAYDLYAAERFDKAALDELVWQDVDVIYCEDAKIYSTNTEVEFTNLYQDENVSYKLVK